MGTRRGRRKPVRTTARPLTSRIGRRVRYGVPGDVRAKGGAGPCGWVVDEVWAEPRINRSNPHTRRCEYGRHCWGDYSLCAQLIEWDAAWDPPQIRLAYYRRRCGENHWTFASQMTVSAEWRRMRALLRRTLAKTAWFRDRPRKKG
jgi:hypothetical protein